MMESQIEFYLAEVVTAPPYSMKKTQELVGDKADAAVMIEN